VRASIDTVTTQADGSFTIRALPDDAILAELGDRRSQPRIIGSATGALALTLAPTRSIAGRIASDDEALAGVLIFAHYELTPTTSWNLMAPVTRSRDYELANIPSGQATLRLDSFLDPNQPQRKLDFGPVRDAAPLRWPVGPTIDAIVRGDFPTATVMWLFRGAHTAKTFAEAEQLASTSSDMMMHGALVIGIGDQTAEAMRRYLPRDRHGRFVGVPPGQGHAVRRRIPAGVARDVQRVRHPRRRDGDARWPRDLPACRRSSCVDQPSRCCDKPRALANPGDRWRRGA